MAKATGGMAAAMKGKGMPPVMTGGAGGGLGRIEKSAVAGANGSQKIKTTAGK